LLELGVYKEILSMKVRRGKNNIKRGRDWLQVINCILERFYIEKVFYLKLFPK